MDENIFCRYIYGGSISLEKYDTSDIIKILKAASEFSLQELISHLQSFLIENKTNWVEQNFSLIYQTSFERGSFRNFKNFALTQLLMNQIGFLNRLTLLQFQKNHWLPLFKTVNFREMKLKYGNMCSNGGLLKIRNFLLILLAFQKMVLTPQGKPYNNVFRLLDSTIYLLMNF